ncbi:MAG: lipocalin family protein [Candidatus Latescibacter sp.]|nr:lipocalin family protein [Candidatus Latescibacter sp.]
MKKCSFLLLLIWAGCGQNNNVTPKPINTVVSYGNDKDMSIASSWVNKPGDIKLSFFKNNTYSYLYNDGDYQFSEKGSYSIAGNSIHAKDSDGYSYRETFLINNNTLSLSDEYGYSQIFTRK